MELKKELIEWAYKYVQDNLDNACKNFTYEVIEEFNKVLFDKHMNHVDLASILTGVHRYKQAALLEGLTNADKSWVEYRKDVAKIFYKGVEHFLKCL